MELFNEIAIAIIVAAACGGFAHFLKQPVITGFIFAGLIISFLGYLANENMHIVEGLSQIGVTLLLFLVGLEMSVKELKHVGRPAVLTGLGQIIFTFGGGFFIARAFDLSWLVSFYIALALTFSSTIIIVKLLSEKRDLNSLYGRIVIGFLLVQDLVAIIALVVLAGLQQGGDNLWLGLSATLLKGMIFVVITMLASRVLPRFLGVVAHSAELLYLFSIAWALGVAALAASPLIGLSIEVGGFLAGLALARSAEHFQIGARLKPLRDFFIILFFVALGAQMIAGYGLEIVSVLGPLMVPIVVFSLFVLIGNPLIVLIIMGILGYRSRTSFLASLTVAQISEFSLILAASGLQYGHLAKEHVLVITVVGIITIFASSYFILLGEKLYTLFRPVVKLFEFRKTNVENHLLAQGDEMVKHVVVVGVHRMGQSVLHALREAGELFVAVDYDPTVVHDLQAKKLPVVYGDVADPEIQDIVHLSAARVVVSTIPDYQTSKAVLLALKEGGSKAKVIVTASSEHEGLSLYEEGADYVLLPHFVGGIELVDLFRENSEFKGLTQLRERDLKIIAEEQRHSYLTEEYF
jgi:Kef-type K+ transport system membrane component KefB/Trk K+ transport system NAD-binding subunit